jgi:hypothetical protein
MTYENRTYTAGRFALDIDGYNVGFLKKFSGLAMEADVVAHDLGPDNVQKKHVANIKWTPGKASVGIGMGAGMYRWIQQSFDKSFAMKSGTFTSADFNYKAQAQATFMNALITSVTVPKLDGASKESAYFDIEFDAEQVRWAKGSGHDIRSQLGVKQKSWLCANFRVEIGGLPCARVASVDSFTWKQSIVADQVGAFREPTKHPAKVTVPDIKLAISYADHAAWAQAAKKWFVDGHHGERDEMTGRIVFLDPTMNRELGDVTLDNVGFKKFADEDSEASSEKIKRFAVELYVEKMTFHIREYDA